jgi:hypothetical protein
MTAVARAFGTGKWRQAVGLIAAYALALNVILMAFAVPGVGQPASADPFSVICLSGGGHVGAADDGSGTQAPAHHGSHHCALCGCTPAAAPPLQVFLNLQAGRSSLPSPRETQGPAADLKSLPGQPRAPPPAA